MDALREQSFKGHESYRVSSRSSVSQSGSSISVSYSRPYSE